MNCVHHYVGGDTRFDAGIFITDFKCKFCGRESTTRASYIPWNAPTAARPQFAPATRLRTLAEERS